MAKSLDLRFSKSTFYFFSQLTAIKEEIKEIKSNAGPDIRFTKADELEIGRGNSYALFDELKDSKITIDSFRRSLAKRGVVDLDLQNKVLCMILQDKIGVHFVLAKLVNSLFLDNDHTLLLNSTNYELSLEVNNNKKLTLVFNGIWEDYTTAPRIPAISVRTAVTITPEAVAVNKFEITQLSSSGMASNAYQFLEKHQQNILEKIISYIKQFFGFNEELRLEEHTIKNR